MPVILSSKSRRRSKRIDDDAQLIQTSLKRYKITAEAESEWRRQALEDLRFSIGTGQWDEGVKASREIEGKPCLTINRAPAFLRQYTGEERQHRPSMLVSPVGSGADLEVAKVHQGALRHIEVASVAESVYDDSYDMMMRIGWCPWRVVTDYISDQSFDQEPRIQAVENPFSTYISPVRAPDGTDPLWCHFVRDYQKDEYEAEFGAEADMVRLNFPIEQGNSAPEWVTKDGCRVAEYWWMELTPKRLCLLDDGRTVFKDDMPARAREDGSGRFSRNRDLDRIVGERDTVQRKVCCVKHDAMRIIQRYEYVGRYIPVVEVNGVRLNINGKIYRAGMVRDYRDAQRIYDFMVTRAVEQVDMVSKDPLWVPEENAQFGEEYRQMNRRNWSHLFYKAYTKDGKQLPAPNRLGREAPVQAMQELIKQADYDMKAVVGLYGPSLGEESGNANESGFAILTRQQQSDTGSVTWHEQLNRAITWEGRILLDLWPKVIPAARVQRIINPDDSTGHRVVFNGQYSSPEEAQRLLDQAKGLHKAYDVGAGTYDLTLSSGPMYKTARQEAFRALTSVITMKPELMPVLGDVWAKNADFPDADVIEARLKKMLPPELQEQEPGDLQKQMQAQAAQLAALSQQHNQLVAELNRAADIIRTKRLDIESKERIAFENNRTQLVIQQMKTEGEAAMASLNARLQEIAQRMQQLHAYMTIDQEAGAAPDTPELPGGVEPKVLPITPAAPVGRPQMIPGPAGPGPGPGPGGPV